MSFYNNKNTVGQHGFYFFFGVVEDRADPLKICRVRVRCHGIHSASKTDIPTDHLPWATVFLPTTSNDGGMADLKIGCNVFGFFADGEEMQIPMVIGVVPGIVSEIVSGNAPTKPPEAPQQAIADSSVSAYAIGGKRLAGLSKASLRRTGIPIVGGSFDEPNDPYAAKYPYNHASESESGHVIELDDTPDGERVHIFHRSGSFVEMHPDGTVVHKSVNDDYEICMKDKKLSVKGNFDISAEGYLNIHCTGNINIVPNSSVNIDGDVIVSGDVVASGVSLVNHIHGGVRSGGSNTTSPI
jgi:hypothetical protein